MDAVQIAVKNWKAAGIQVEIKPKEYDAFISSAIYGKFDKMMLAPRDSATEPDSYFTPLLPGHPLNASGVNDPKLTEMIKLQRRTYDEKSAERSSTTSSAISPSRCISPAAPR